jgi:hypothetical protein
MNGLLTFSISIQLVLAACPTEKFPMLIGGSSASCEYHKVSVSTDGALAFGSGVCWDGNTFGIVSIFDLGTSEHLASYEVVDADYYNICESEEISGLGYYFTCMYFNSLS